MDRFHGIIREEDATCGAEFCSGDQMTQGEKGIDAPATVQESEGNHVRRLPKIDQPCG